MIRRRDAERDGIAPAQSRIVFPCDLDARWAARGEESFWCGYKVRLTEICQDVVQYEPAVRRLDPPNIITHVVTADATMPDVAMTAQGRARENRRIGARIRPLWSRSP